MLLTVTVIVLVLLLAHTLGRLAPPTPAGGAPILIDRRLGQVRVRAGHLHRVRAARLARGLPVWTLTAPRSLSPLEDS